MVNSLVAAITMASLWVGNAPAELIDVPAGYMIVAWMSIGVQKGV